MRIRAYIHTYYTYKHSYIHKYRYAIFLIVFRELRTIFIHTCIYIHYVHTFRSTYTYLHTYRHSGIQSTRNVHVHTHVQAIVHKTFMHKVSGRNCDQLTTPSVHLETLCLIKAEPLSLIAINCLLSSADNHIHCFIWSNTVFLWLLSYYGKTEIGLHILATLTVFTTRHMIGLFITVLR